MPLTDTSSSAWVRPYKQDTCTHAIFVPEAHGLKISASVESSSQLTKSGVIVPINVKPAPSESDLAEKPIILWLEVSSTDQAYTWDLSQISLHDIASNRNYTPSSYNIWQCDDSFLGDCSFQPFSAPPILNTAKNNFVQFTLPFPLTYSDISEFSISFPPIISSSTTISIPALLFKQTDVKRVNRTIIGIND